MFRYFQPRPSRASLKKQIETQKANIQVLRNQNRDLSGVNVQQNNDILAISRELEQLKTEMTELKATEKEQREKIINEKNDAINRLERAYKTELATVEEQTEAIRDIRAELGRLEAARDHVRDGLRNLEDKCRRAHEVLRDSSLADAERIQAASQILQTCYSAAESR